MSEPVAPELQESTPEITLSTPPKPTARRLFLGDDGLRAGWSLFLFILLFSLFSFGLTALIAKTHLLPPPHHATAAERTADINPRQAFIGEFFGLVALLLAAGVMSWAERRPFARYGLPLRRALPDFAVGLLWGFLFLSLLIGGLLVTHTIAFDGVALHGAAALQYAGKWAAVFLFVGLLEEFLFRGYFQYTLARGIAGITQAMSPGNRYVHAISFWGAAFLFSIVLFTVAHTSNAGETVPGILAVALAGTVFAFSLYRTGSLWWAVGFHTSWDWAQSYFYGTADSGTHSAGHFLSTHPLGSTLISGGSAGPEGSLLVIPTLLLVGLVIHLTLPRRPYPLTPDQTYPRPPEHLHSL